ncbi:MAG: branched-chain amino acid ABC transporter permease [Actinobacteria bacterium]|nr:MAG: branched-chain amino acid ABC transporter permease [Actinomycetota bacterium]
MTDLVAILVSGVILGSVYALVAIGMTLVYGILRVLDMSQGSMVMAGGFAGWAVLTSWGLNPLVALLFAFAITFGLGVATQLVSVQPLLGRTGVDFEMITFITTFAVATVIQNVALEVFGPRQKDVPPIIGGTVNIYHGVSISMQSILMAIVSIAIIGLLGAFIARSRYGVAIRAVAQDLDAARLMAVPVRGMFPIVMGFASALAGVAGVFLGALYFASPTTGELPLLIALIVVIFGGLGSLLGTIYAAYAIGLIQSSVSVEIGTQWAFPVLYAVILAVLVVRPQGLAGRPSEARL